MTFSFFQRNGNNYPRVHAYGSGSALANWFIVSYLNFRYAKHVWQQLANALQFGQGIQ